MGGVTLFQLMGKLAIDGVEETTKALDEVSKKGKDAEKELSVSFSEIGAKAGELGKKMAIGLGAIATGVIAGVETTREFRQDLGKLNTTFTETGSSTETAKNVFKDFFGLLGEDDTSIEASNHLAMMTNNQKDLEEWTRICTGVYATFGDSLPLEGLTEASNETMRTGKLTGVLADALNWAGISEEEFQEKLDKTNSEAEREALLRETLTGLYGDSADTFRDMNGDIIANNEAQADLNLKLAETMNKIEPLITKGKIFLAEVLDKISPAIEWIIENINILAPIILGFLGTLFALNIASKVMAFIPIVKSLFLVLSANPIGLIITAIGLLVTAFITLWNNCEWFRDFWKGLWEILKNTVSVAIDFIVEWFNKIVNFVKENWQGLLLLIVNPFAGAFKLLYDNCEGFRNFVDKWIKKIKDFFVNGFNSIKEKVTSTFSNFKNGIVNIATNIKDGVVNKINSLKTGITNIFNNIKTTATNIFNKVKTAITSPIEKARDIVKGVVDKIKGFFNFKVELPKIKLPHFSITPKGWELGDLLKGVKPKLGIEWYAEGGILNRPTAFGMNGNNVMVGGEAGPEAIAPISELMKYTTAAVDGSNRGLEDKLDRLVGLLTNYLPALANKQVVLSTGELVGAMVNPMDKALGDLTNKRGRGY